MTNEIGTLSGLIAELETFHRGLDTGYCEACLMGNCDGDHASWPCPTMQIVQTHKRAMLQDGALDIG